MTRESKSRNRIMPTEERPNNSRVIYKATPRRRSSAFRPTNLSYPFQQESKSIDDVFLEEPTSHHMSIEDLPHSLLLLVFSYLHTQDLLNICLLSKFTYLPAVIQLYKKILISFDNNDAHLPSKFLDKVSVNIGTVVRQNRLPILLRVLQSSEKLSSIVKSIVFIYCHELMNRESVKLIDKILNEVSLSQLFSPHFPLYDMRLKNINFGGIQRLGINIGNVNDYESLKSIDIKLPRLSHLKIYYDINNSNNSKSIVELAKTLNESLDTLTTLEFENHPENQLGHLQELNLVNKMKLGHSNNEPVWAVFFSALSNIRSTKLRLTDLALDGFIADTGSKQSRLLNDTIDLSRIKSLQSKVTELTHANSSHFDGAIMSNFLYNIASLTLNLTKLSIHTTHDCFLCQHQCNTFVITKLLLNKLKTLVITTETPDLVSANELNEAIYKFQVKLINLKINNRSIEWQNKQAFFKATGDISKSIKPLYEQSVFYEECISKDLFHDYFLQDIESISTSLTYSLQEALTYRRNSVIVNDPMTQLIKLVKNEKCFLSFLYEYLSSNNHLAQIKCLPNLQFILILGFPLYIESEHGVKKVYLMNSYGDPYEFCFEVS